MSGTNSGNTTTFSYDGKIDTVTLAAGTYDITATGATGGGLSNDFSLFAPSSGGFGAVVTGTFTLSAPETLSILVGAAGGSASDGSGAGGGGGSFVVGPNTAPLLIAGGGGGGGEDVDNSGNFFGSNGGNGGAIASSGGNGGIGGSTFYAVDGGGGGGGLIGNGTSGINPDDPTDNSGGGGGFSFVNGGAGGSPGADASGGGFGGGGGGSFFGAGGGGGGYTGGNGATGPGAGGSAAFYGGGRGGTSFDAGVNPLFSLASSGSGSVKISQRFTPVVVPESFSAHYDGTVTLSQSQLLAGDTDPEGGTLKVTAVSANSGAVLNPDDTVTYTASNTPIAGDKASFTYTVTDTAGYASTATANVSLTAAIVPITATPGPTTVSTTDEKAVAPFSSVAITDANASQTETANVTLSSGANGTLSDPNASADGSVINNGTLTVSGSANAVATALNGLVFTPTAHQVTPGATVQTTVTAAISDTAGQAALLASTVTATAVNDPPVISGAKAGQTTTGTTPVTPFSGISVMDPDTGVQDSLTITLTGAGGTLSGAGLSPTGAVGTYSLAAAIPGTLTSELEALTFTPAAGGTPGTSGTTTFTLTASQTAGGSTVSTSDGTTTVIDQIPFVPPTLKTNPLPVTVAEGQTTTNLYQTLVQDVQDANLNAHVSITSLGLSNTMGFAYLDQADGLLTYTADGDQPSAKQPQDSFTYTAVDQYGQQVTGTVAVTVIGANETTQVGSTGNDTLTASSANTRLIGGNGDDTLNANAAKTLVFGGNGNDTINVNAAQTTVYGGTGSNTINLGNTAKDTIVLQQGGTDQISGFNLKNDVLDLTQVLAEAQKSFSASDFQVSASGNNATLSYVGTPSFTGGGTLAVLYGVGSGVTLQTLISDGALKVS